MRPLYIGSELILLLLFALSGHAQQKPLWLSHLNAGSNSPLYTTYAAALERSQFTLDEGYHFVFYDSSRGAEFSTDTGGDLCLAFKKGMDYVYEVHRYYQEPVILISYPDMLRYRFQPFPEVEAEATFLVYSSLQALWQVTLKNVSSESLELEVFPFLRNRYRVFNDVEFHADQRAITFTHEELPDGWVLEHQIPYVNPVRDVLLISQPPERLTSFRSYRWEEVSVPQQFDLNRPPRYVLWGRIDHANGERCRHQQPAPILQVMRNEDSTQILIENAPRWGSSDPTISPYGYYGVELGNFSDLKDGDVVSLYLLCPQTGESGVLRDTVRLNPGSHRVRKNIRLKPDPLLNPAPRVDKDIWGSGTEIRLFWEYAQTGARFQVYRRDYRREGVYRMLARNLARRFYTDRNIQGDQIYGYVVTARSPGAPWGWHSTEVTNIAGSDFLTDVRYPNQIRSDVPDLARVVALPLKMTLAPGESQTFRVIRAVGPMEQTPGDLIDAANSLLDVPLDGSLQANQRLFANIPQLSSDDPELQLLYWSAFNLMRQVMLPPEGQCSYNYYVFSREPQWGWGHGGQVFHESLAMLAYALMDPLSAMDSQRIYRERQRNDGYINYRTGPYLNETIPYNHQLTTSAPWYAWQNWMIYQISGDDTFLKEMYASSRAFYRYYVKNRDSDGDGLCEWGAHAVLESVRDALVAVWDQVDWPDKFEALDLNCMLVQEAKALANMARELGKEKEARQWKADARRRAALINQYMWDEKTGFYYHVDKADHDFSYRQPDDLKRQEIIGFLPLWAGIADEEQALRLIAVLTDSSKFWRPYGVPSLAADDPYYNPRGYWNGPVWVEWDYLIVYGLLQYGYKELARELTHRVARNMIAVLKQNHQLWEFYSPDEHWGGYHSQYIWAGLIARMLLDVYGSR